MIGGLTGVGMLVENDVFLFCSVLVSMASFLSRPWFATGCCREGFLYSGIQCAGASNKSLQHGVLFCGTQCSSARIFAAAFCRWG
jgi:hypothetical protein